MLQALIDTAILGHLGVPELGAVGFGTVRKSSLFQRKVLIDSKNFCVIRKLLYLSLPLSFFQVVFQFALGFFAALIFATTPIVASYAANNDLPGVSCGAHIHICTLIQISRTNLYFCCSFI